MTNKLTDRLAELNRVLASLPEAPEPPPSMLEIIRTYQQEQDWQRLLVFFLTPGEAHGLDTAFLEHFLAQLAERCDQKFSFSRLDLQTIEVAQEVTLSNGRIPDLVIWSPENWFICFELKVGAIEGEDQTRSYVEAKSFQSIDLDKAAVPSDDHHYVYLAPEDAPSSEADEFVPLSWEWVATEIQAFLEASHGAHPAWTTAQLDDFAETIQHELSMTDYHENQREKAALYFEYYDEITAVQAAFEDQWDDFADHWGTQLADAIEPAEIIELPGQPEGHVVIQIEHESGVTDRWMFRQTDSDWAGISLDRWRRDKDDPSKIYPQTDTTVHVTLYHRLEQNRDRAINDQTLELKLWHGTDNGDQFMEMFNEKLATKMATNDTTVPPTATLTGGTGSVFVAEYDIPTADHDDFFDAYIAALRTAFLDLFVEHRSLVTAIDEAFDESVEIFR